MTIGAVRAIGSLRPDGGVSAACRHWGSAAPRQAPAVITVRDQLATRQSQAGTFGVAERTVCWVARFSEGLLLYTAVLSDRVGCRGVRRPRMVTLGTVRSLERLDCRLAAQKARRPGI